MARKACHIRLFSVQATVFSVLYVRWILPISDIPISSSFYHCPPLLCGVSFLQRQPAHAFSHSGAFHSKLCFFSSCVLAGFISCFIFIFFFFSADSHLFLHFSLPVVHDAPGGPAVPSAVLAGHERAQL